MRCLDSDDDWIDLPQPGRAEFISKFQEKFKSGRCKVRDEWKWFNKDFKDNKTVMDWFSHGFDSDSSHEWRHWGFNPSDAYSWCNVFGARDAKYWRDTHWKPEEALVLSKLNFSPEQAFDWRHRDFRNLKEVQEWHKIGLTAKQARSWKKFEFDPPTTAGCIKRGCSADCAYIYLNSDLLLGQDQIIEELKSGCMRMRKK